MQDVIHRCLLLLTGATLALIGVTYCLDPNLLLARYELSVVGASDDNMYRGAYGGLFITLGAAIGYGFFSAPSRRTSTMIALLFMGGFALGRMSSILALGMPHQQIIGLLVFELCAAAMFAWFLLAERRSWTGG